MDYNMETLTDVATFFCQSNKEEFQVREYLGEKEQLRTSHILGNFLSYLLRFGVIGLSDLRDAQHNIDSFHLCMSCYLRWFMFTVPKQTSRT